MIYLQTLFVTTWANAYADYILSEIDLLVTALPCRCGSAFMRRDVLRQWHQCIDCGAISVDGEWHASYDEYQSAVEARRERLRLYTEQLYDHWRETGVMPENADDNDFRKG